MYEQKSLLDKMKTFDIYKKLPKEYLQPTCVGAILTLFTFALSTYLFFFEFSRYFQIQTKSEMLVDMTEGSDKITINFDITFPSLPCVILSLDVADSMGGHSFNLEGTVTKKPLDSIGNIKEEFIQDYSTNRDGLYERVKKDFDEKNGCRIAGDFNVSRVPGNFHFSSHPYRDILQRFLNDNNRFTLNMTHIINHLSFGKNENLEYVKGHFDVGVLNPLDGVKKVDNINNNIYEYYLNIVPTKYINLDSKEYNLYQFTVNHNVDKTPRNFPAVFYRLNTSPVLVKYTQVKPNMINAVVNICAIFGGMFTLAGIFDMLILRFFKETKENKTT